MKDSGSSRSSSGESSAADETRSTEATVPATSEGSTETTEKEIKELHPANVTGLSQEEATAQLKAQGYNVEILGYEYSSDIPFEHVTRTSPTSEQTLSTDCTVYLYLSNGPDPGGSDSEGGSSESSDSENSSESSGESSGSENGDSSSSESSSNGNDSNEGGSDNNGGNSVQNVRTAPRSPAAANTSIKTNVSSGSDSGSSSKKFLYMSVSSTGSDNNFIPYKNNTRYLTESEVNAMSREELNLALNEIYARRGRIFTNASLASYFNSQSWYNPVYTEDEFVANVVFNDYESKNVDLIRKVQEQKGYF